MASPDFKAIYGIFNIDMTPAKVIDVTDTVINNFLQDGKINIPSKKNFDDYFATPYTDNRNFLQIETPVRRYNILQDDYSCDISIDLNDTRKRIKLVYYAYIYRKSNWQTIISGQLLQLKSYGLLDEVDLYVHLTDPANIFVDAEEIIMKICNKANISKSNINQFEYPGIRLVYDLAKQYPEGIILYLHTKGISRDIQSRKPKEILILAATFENWRKNMEAFTDPIINKLGLFPAIEGDEDKIAAGVKAGWIWYNFWYARGTYLMSCEEPSIKEDRWYFENWLGGSQHDQAFLRQDCRSLWPNKTKNYFTGEEADELMSRLRKILQDHGIHIN